MSRWCWRRNVLQLPVLRRTANRGRTCQGQAPRGWAKAETISQILPFGCVVPNIGQHQSTFSNTTKVDCVLWRVTECSNFFDHSIGPTRPMGRVGSAQSAPETDTAHAQMEAADFPSGTVRELSKKGTVVLPNAGVMMPCD